MQTLTETPGFRLIGVDDGALSRDGMKMFGVLDLESRKERSTFRDGTQKQSRQKACASRYLSIQDLRLQHRRTGRRDAMQDFTACQRWARTQSLAAWILVIPLAGAGLPALQLPPATRRCELNRRIWKLGH